MAYLGLIAAGEGGKGGNIEMFKFSYEFGKKSRFKEKIEIPELKIYILDILLCSLSMQGLLN